MATFAYPSPAPSNRDSARDNLLQGSVDSVLVRDLRKSYGTNHILKSLSMTVPAGSIYGLLGPSGCGKTTFLKIILGRLSPDAGIEGDSEHPTPVVEVLGAAPATPGHEVPGSLVGYMPQEIALYPEFTIAETLEFYSQLHGMTPSMFEQRKNFLLGFLNLPSPDRLVRNLSGGQQRRVSLCVALLHNPRLLILDEPTVGVDPVLRARIWDYLVEIARSGVSIIITTHYIEEARQANTVGFMRDGKILVEGHPDDLLRATQKDNLEDVFLALCHAQHTTDEDGDPVPIPEMEAIVAHQKERQERNQQRMNVGSKLDQNHTASVHRESEPGCCFGLFQARNKNINALISRSFKRMVRNWTFLLFTFLVPALQVVLFCVAIGQQPKGIHLSVVNQDTGIMNIGPIPISPPIQFSNSFLAKIDENNIILDYHDDMESAIQQVKDGKSWGVLYMGQNYTLDLVQRFLPFDQIITEDVIQGSTISLNLDQTNQQIYVSIQEQINIAFESFMVDFLTFLEKFGDINPDTATLPIKIADPPIFGSAHPRFTDFIAPGMIINIAFASSIGLTALAFVIDKREGSLDRVYSCGVLPSELMIGHIVTQFLVLLVQIALLLFCALYVFSLPQVGSLLWVILLSVMLGFSGMLYGLVISASAEKEQEAIQMSMGSFFPVMLLSGVIWPVNAIPWGLRWLSLALPTTWASSAMRSILNRGWSFLDGDVWLGFTVVFAWILYFLHAANKGLRNRD